MHKECWIFYEPGYERLREVEGCDRFGDLPTTRDDKERAKYIARCAGVEGANIRPFTRMTKKDLI